MNTPRQLTDEQRRAVGEPDRSYLPGLYQRTIARACGGLQVTYRRADGVREPDSRWLVGAGGAVTQPAVPAA